VIRGLDHVQLAAPPGSETEARRFFGGLLGLEELPKPASLAARGGVWFACGAQQLHVGMTPDFAPAEKAHPAFAVGDLDVLADRLVEAAVDVRWDGEVPGVARFYASDPWGNRLEFVSAGAPPGTPSR
jgi:catechol 2,3-dioxygenase-like lactoylglutathione lyase family enzyme